MINCKYTGLTLLRLLLLTAAIDFSSCSKHTYDQTLPSVSFLSVAPYGLSGDSVLISGRVNSPGLSAVQFVGFAYSTQTSFSILNNQFLANVNASPFTAIVPVSPDSTYYFKAFASNSYGYSCSNLFKYAASISGSSAPCNLSSNTALDNGVNYTLSDVNSGGSYATFGTFGVEADNGAYETINIFFNGNPPSGTYTTVANLSALNGDTNPFDVGIEINGNSVNAGCKVYVTVNANKTTTVSFCSGEYQSYENQYASAKITY